MPEGLSICRESRLTLSYRAHAHGWGWGGFISPAPDDCGRRVPLWGGGAVLLVFAQRASLLVWASPGLMLAPLRENHAPAVVSAYAAHMLHKPHYSHHGAAWLACLWFNDLAHF